MTICAFIKPNGTHCERRIKVDAVYCYSHDPDRQEDRTRSAKKGAAGRWGEVSEIKRFLRQLADDVLNGEVQTSKASVAAQCLGVAARFHEIEIRGKLEDIEEELEELQELADSARRRHGTPQR